jgi:alpha-D-ribose 1-methylphosphonate 5-triphosphate synthase subunit PhnH
MAVSNLEGGFADAPTDAARAFRALMGVMARPGEIATVAGAAPPAPLSIAAGAVILTLCDPDTPVYLATALAEPRVVDWLRFHTGAPLAAPEAARFAFGPWEALKGLPFAIGTPEYPDRSATLVVELPSLDASGATLTGPGIRETAALSLPETEAFAANRRLFPLGLDFFFTCGDRIAALPRSTEVR